MGYSFTWILNHLSQSYTVASASWAAYAVSASYVPLLAGPNITINYQPNGIAITGSAGSIPQGPSGSLQFISASVLSGSNNLVYDYDTNNLYLTGGFNISGAISASFGPNTVGFYGTASWAVSSSQALTASFITASNVYGPYGSSSVASASWASQSVSASYASVSAISIVSADNFWTRSLGDNSAVLKDPLYQSFAGGTSSLAFGAYTSASGDFSFSHGGRIPVVPEYSILTYDYDDYYTYDVFNIGGNNVYTTDDTDIIQYFNNGYNNPMFVSVSFASDPPEVYQITDIYYDNTLFTYVVIGGNLSGTSPTTARFYTTNANSPSGYLIYSANIPSPDLIASGLFSHAEGVSTIASGTGSHAEGWYTTASAKGSHAEGLQTYTPVPTGNMTEEIRGFSHAEGFRTIASGALSHAEGYDTISSGNASHAEGWLTRAIGFAAHAEGYLARAIGDLSHAEGSGYSHGPYSHAEGSGNSYGSFSHAEGGGNSYGAASHAEGDSTIASGTYSHAEGVSSKAFGFGSHTEGLGTEAYGNSSHAEGANTLALGDFSHAEGSSSVSYGVASHAEGLHTIASGAFQNTIGQYNLRNNTTDLFVIGDGTDDNNRHDLLNAGIGYVNITGSATISSSLNVIGVSNVTGSNNITGSWNLIGQGNVTGSLIVSNSFTVIGDTNFTGSVTISSSLNVIGTSNVTGSNNISGSWNLIGDGVVSGSLLVSSSLTTIGTHTVSGSLLVTGSQTNIGPTTITGSNNITGSWELIGQGNVTGSLIVSNSFSVIGDSNFNGNTNFTGSVTISSSLNVIGTSNVTGSNNITGSWNLIGPGTITGSLIVSNSLTVIGTNTTTGSVFITGSSTLIGNQYITGSILMTGSAAISEVNYIDFVTGSEPIHRVGRIHWDEDFGTLNIDLDSTSGNEVMSKVGLDNFYYVENKTGTTLDKGKVIRASGSLGSSGKLLGAYMIADNSIPYYYTLGIAAENIDHNQAGYVYEFGLLRGIQTNGANYGETWLDGTILYVSTGSLGGLTSVEPTGPNPKIQMAIVIKADSSNGSIFIRPDLRSNVGDLHNVNDINSSDGDLFVKSGSVWTNTKQLTGSYGLTGSLSVQGFISASAFSGSLYGTASWAQSTVTSSYPISISGSTIYSTGPLAGGLVFSTINSIFLGSGAGASATNANNSNFLGVSAGNGANNANDSNFLGYEAGFQAFNAESSNFLGYQAGYQATNAQYSNFLGYLAGAGATNARFSNFLGPGAGNVTNAESSNFLGPGAGLGATNASFSNFLGADAGSYAENASYSTLIGLYAGSNGFGNSIGTNNIIIGNNITLANNREDSINLGGLIFGTGTYNGGIGFSGSAGGNIGINEPLPTHNFQVSGTVAFPNLTSTSQTSVVTYNSLTGQLFYTASTAVGSAAVLTYTNGVDNRIITSTGPTGINGEANLTFDGTDLNLTGSLNVSGTLHVSSSNTNQSQPSMQVNNEGLFILGEFTTTPTAVAGALMYSGSDYYLGFP